MRAAKDFRTTSDLVADYCKGDNRAFTEIYDRYAAFLRRMISRIIKDDCLVDDVLQVVLIKIYLLLKRGQYDRTLGSFPTLIGCIATSTALDEYRKMKSVRYGGNLEKIRIGSDDYEAIAIPDSQAQSAIAMAEIKEDYAILALGLSVGIRSVLDLAVFNQCKEQEIGILLGISQSAVKCRLHRARKHMRTQLAKEPC